MNRAPIIALAIAAALPQATAASAAVVDFSGSMAANPSPFADPTCAPIPFRGIITNAPGTSPLGNFTYSHNACTTGSGGGPVVGTYTINLGGDLLEGSFSGTASPSGTPGISNLLFTYLITSGTGQFLGATGSFIGQGTADTRTAPPSIVSLSFRAVPEPATWAMMLLGFAGIGMTVRRRQTPALRPA